MNNFISLILFIVALGVLITIHELGHLLTAKMFNVYCSDFSIGFGYKILKISRDDPEEKKNSLIWIKSKNKKRETNFSIGVVPLGGYVAMLGDDDDETIKNNPTLKGRSVEDLSYWKKIIVFLAGIFMNFALAWLIFFISASCFEQKKVEYINLVEVTDSASLKTSLTSDENGLIPFEIASPTKDANGNIETSYIISTNAFDGDDSGLIYSVNDPAYPVKISGNNNNYSLIFDTTNVGFNDTDYANSFKLVLAEAKTTGTPLYYPVLDAKNAYTEYTFSAGETISPIRIQIKKEVLSTKEKTISTAYLHLSLNSENKLNKVGFGIYVNSYWNGFKSFEVASKNWATSTDLIGRTLFRLFYDSSTWSNVGGPVAIFTQTTSILADYPFYVYLNTWGVISVNLAIFNLLPFPGLDGWQILVAVIEWIVNGFKKIKNKKNKNVVTPINSDAKEINVGEKQVENSSNNRWKFPPKIKNIISYVGLGLLFALMIVIFIKDIIGLF
jgi:membrane-associated protease RseP (regulator of RpoE activity)